MKNKNTWQNDTRSYFPKGFTLIELLVVVLIIGVLVAVALPRYNKTTQKTYYAGMLPILAAVVEAQKVYYLANGEYTPDMTQLDISLSVTETCEASENVGAGYRIGEYCVSLNEHIDGNGAEFGTGIGIGMAVSKWGLSESRKYRPSGYEYVLEWRRPNDSRKAGKTYCKTSWLATDQDFHCAGKMLHRNSFGAWYEME